MNLHHIHPLARPPSPGPYRPPGDLADVVPDRLAGFGGRWRRSAKCLVSQRKTHVVQFGGRWRAWRTTSKPPPNRVGGLGGRRCAGGVGSDRGSCRRLMRMEGLGAGCRA